MAKNYRIRIEALDGAPSVIPPEAEKIKCEGFVLLAMDSGKWTVVEENLSREEMARGLVQDHTLVEAAMIAKAFAEVQLYDSQAKAEAMKKLFSIPMDGQGKPKSR